VAGELVKAGGPHRSASLQRQLADAVRAFEAERYADALRAVKPVVSAAPAAGSVRELHGLILYRLGRWRAALDELAVAHRLTQSFDQHPVMADCQRALGRHAKVEALWNELRRASPTADVLAEGRMVLAGSLADRGKVSDAIAVLDPFGADRARPKPWQLRTWYALADLYERGGDVPHARELFRRLVRHDAGFHDVVERLAAL
jgi:tetratricopeptide (TPR) repeat protein